jgi:hypothetical protein
VIKSVVVFFCDEESRSVPPLPEMPMMSKPYLKAPLFARHIFIYSEAGGIFWWGGHDYPRNQLVFWSSQKKMTDIAQDDEGGVSAHRH